MLPKYGQQFVNQINEHRVDATTITAAFANLVDLGEAQIYNHIAISNSGDQNIILRFGGDKTITIDAGNVIVFDSFNHNGVIESKYETSVPTSGMLIIRSW